MRRRGYCGVELVFLAFFSYELWQRHRSTVEGLDIIDAFMKTGWNCGWTSWCRCCRVTSSACLSATMLSFTALARAAFLDAPTREPVFVLPNACCAFNVHSGYDAFLMGLCFIDACACTSDSWVGLIACTCR